MLKIKYSLFWILLSMPSCLGAEETLTFFCYQEKKGHSAYEYICINAPNKEVIKEEILKTKGANPNSGEYLILANKDWQEINPEKNNITTSLEKANVDFYTSDELKQAFEQDYCEEIGLLGEKWKETFNVDYPAMKKAFEAYKESTIDLSTQDDLDKTVQNSLFLVILLGTLGVAAFFLWLSDKEAPSEDKTAKAKKLKTELRRENDNPRSDTMPPTIESR